MLTNKVFLLKVALMRHALLYIICEVGNVVNMIIPHVVLALKSTGQQKNAEHLKIGCIIPPWGYYMFDE